MERISKINLEAKWNNIVFLIEKSGGRIEKPKKAIRNTLFIIFDNGRIYYKNQFEGIMYHLFWFKKNYNANKKVLKVPDKYYISKTKIYHSR